MREIRFRVWDKKEKTMNYSAEGRIVDGRLIAFDLMIEWRRNIYSSEWELMQFTGLLDKNGKEIFEGDILKCERDYWETPRNLVVEWNEDCWALLKTDDPVDSEVLNHNSSFNVPEYYREVIGNIYENPELVGKEE